MGIGSVTVSEFVKGAARGNLDVENSQRRANVSREHLFIGGKGSTRLCYVYSPLLDGHPVTVSHDEDIS
jgi:hypothetical protein